MCFAVVYALWQIVLAMGYLVYFMAYGAYWLVTLPFRIVAAATSGRD